MECIALSYTAERQWCITVAAYINNDQRNPKLAYRWNLVYCSVWRPVLGAGGRIYSLHQAYASRASRCSKLTKPYVLDDHPLACMEAIIHGKNKHKVRACSWCSLAERRASRSKGPGTGMQIEIEQASSPSHTFSVPLISLACTTVTVLFGTAVRII